MKKIALTMMAIFTVALTTVSGITDISDDNGFDMITEWDDTGSGGGSNYFKSTSNCYDKNGNWVKNKVRCMDGGPNSCTTINC